MSEIKGSFLVTLLVIAIFGVIAGVVGKGMKDSAKNVGTAIDAADEIVNTSFAD